MAFSPDGHVLASTSYDPMVKLWNVRSNYEVRVLRGHSLAVTSLCFSPDGQFLASASGEYQEPGEIRLWKVLSGEHFLTFDGLESVSYLGFSADSHELYAREYVAKVHGWRLPSGERLDRKPLGKWLRSARSADGKTFALGSGNGLIYLIPTAASPSQLAFRLSFTQPDPGEHVYLGQQAWADYQSAAKQRPARSESPPDPLAAAFHVGRYLAAKRQLQNSPWDPAPAMQTIGLGQYPLLALSGWVGDEQVRRDRAAFPDGPAFVGIMQKNSGQDPKRILIGAKPAAEAATRLSWTTPLSRDASFAIGAGPAVPRDDWMIIGLYGGALYRAGDHKAALDELNDALKRLDKKEPPAWLCAFLALTHHAAGNKYEAVKWRDRATPPKDDPWDEKMMAELLWPEVDALPK